MATLGLTLSTRTRANDFLLILGASVLISLTAPLAIQLPFSPVPIAFALQLIIALSVLMGSKKATLAVLAYLVQGAVGLPVFANGASGIAYFMGPTGGYLIGYLASAYVSGKLVELVKEGTPSKIFLAMLAGNAMVYFFGLPHLALYVGLEKAFYLGCLPFILGDFVKLLVVNTLISRGASWVKKLSL